MPKRFSAGHGAVLCLVLGAALAAAPAGAQLCVDFVCSAILDCSAGRPQCSAGGCFCRPFCNADADCGSGRICEGGLCVGRLPERCSADSHCPGGQICLVSAGTCFAPCNNRSDCPRGQVCAAGRCGTCSGDADCASGETCSGGLCEPRPASPPAPPECAANRDCDDGNPCDGREVCDMSVCRAGPRPCAVEPPAISRCVVDPPGGGCFRCEVEVPVARPIEGEIEVSAEPVSLPPGVGPGRETGPIPPPGSGKGSSFRARGVLRAPLAAGPPLDLPSARLRIVVADPKGRALFDQTLAPGAWTGDPARGYALSGPAGLIRAVRVTPKGKGDWLVEIEGIAPDPALAKRFARDARPVLALTLDWGRDAASTVAVAELGDCSRPKGRSRTPQALRCRSKGYAAASGGR